MLFCLAGSTTSTPSGAHVGTTDDGNGAGIFACSEFVLFYSALFIYLAAKLAV